MRGCMMPMSSPMMKRMLGFCCCWADAGGMAAVKEAAHASAHSHLLCLILIGTVLRCPVATQPNSERAVRGRYSAHRCERQFRGDTHLTFLCRVSRPTPCFSYSTHVFNFNIALRCLREDLDQKSSPRSLAGKLFSVREEFCGLIEDATEPRKPASHKGFWPWTAAILS